jgi:hypothetical protein
MNAIDCEKQVMDNGDKPGRQSAHGVAIYAKLGICLALWSICLLVLVQLGAGLPQGPSDVLYIFYQPLMHILGMLWLWTVVVWCFETFFVRYEACFATEHLRFLLSSRALAEMSAVFTTQLALSVTVFILSTFYGHNTVASLQPGLLFSVITLSLASPLDLAWEAPYREQRWFFLDTLRRVVLPFQV